MSFVLVEGFPESKTVNIYGPFTTRDEAKDFAYNSMMVPKWWRVRPLLEPTLGYEEEQPPFE